MSFEYNWMNILHQNRQNYFEKINKPFPSLEKKNYLSSSVYGFMKPRSSSESSISSWKGRVRPAAVLPPVFPPPLEKSGIGLYLQGKRMASSREKSRVGDPDAH